MIDTILDDALLILYLMMNAIKSTLFGYVINVILMSMSL